MKAALATITLFFFLFTFSTKPSSVRADLREPVVDSFGENVIANEGYYVLPYLPVTPSGLSFDPFDNSTCPHVVVQEKEADKGKSVKFLPLNPDDNVIYTSSELNIKFSDEILTCNDSGVWSMKEFIEEAWNVATNGVLGSGGFNRFTIERESDGGYNIKSCLDPELCQALWVFVHDNDGKSYVGLANLHEVWELRVQFVKANVTNAIDDVDEAVMSI